MGPEEFKVRPVGAGPFKIVNNQQSSELVLERNPEYWQPDRPYLDRLIFRSVANNQAAYLALLAGDADAAEGITSPLLIDEALANDAITVTQQPSTATYLIQLNTLAPPFANALARQAIYYATDVDAMLSGLFKGQYTSVHQSFTGPGGLYRVEKVPGYRTYDLEKARAIVNELGGIKLTLGTIQSPVAEQLVTALQSQWGAAGIETTIEKIEIGNLIGQLQNRTWQALLQTVGSYDPDASNGVKVRFGSGQLFSGVSDETLDNILLGASASDDPNQEGYLLAAQRISEQAYAPFLFSFAPVQFSTNGLQGPGLTTGIPAIGVSTSILWQDVRFEPRQ
jgi:peptide/nickel transport system substrate-binding protein